MATNFIVAFGLYGIISYEVGDEMEHGHVQGWFKAKCPMDEAGEKLMNKTYKEFMGIRVRSGHKITLKYFRAGQTEQYMTGYILKQWGASHFFFQATGEHFTNIYLEECRASYTIRATNYEKGKQVIERSTMLRMAFAFRTREMEQCPEIRHWCLVRTLVEMINGGTYVIGSKYHVGPPVDLKAMSITFKIICQQADNEVVHVFDVVNALFGSNRPSTMTFGECEKMLNINTEDDGLSNSEVEETPANAPSNAGVGADGRDAAIARQLFGSDADDSE
jgi:hypothetical protein